MSLEVGVFFKVYSQGILNLTNQPDVNVSKLATVVKGDPKAPFSIATRPRRRGELYFFLWNTPLYP